jgi:hypothetical protein
MKITTEQEIDGLEQEIISQLEISSDLSEEFKKQSVFYASWASMGARARAMVRSSEEMVEKSFCMYYAKYRSDHAAAKENDCKAYILSRKSHLKRVQRARRAQYYADMVKVAERAFDMRKDMLMQLGALFRKEYDNTDLNVARKKANDIIQKTYNKDKNRRCDNE